MYCMVCTRPDIAHAVSTVSRFLSNPGKEHWGALGSSEMDLQIFEGYFKIVFEFWGFKTSVRRFYRC